MNLHEYFSLTGIPKRRMAQAINVHEVLICQWTSGVRRIPADHCPSIEGFTHGMVRCEELRPDVNWAVLRTSPKKAPHVQP